MPRLYLSIAALGLAFSSGWLVQGWRLGEQHAMYRTAQAEALAGARELVIATERENQRLQAAASTAYAAAKAQQARETRTITQEVIRYVQSSPADCPLDVEWVRLYNTSLGLSGSADAAGGVAGSTSALRATHSEGRS